MPARGIRRELRARGQLKKVPIIIFLAIGVIFVGSISLFPQGVSQKDEAFVTESGLKYKVLQRGNGAKAEKGKEISLHGIGYFEDGKVFWNSRDERSPFYFVLGKDRVIKGCEEGVALMRVGDRFLFTMKPELAYGEKGRPGTIPANAILIFDYEILSVEDPKISVADPLAQVIKEKGLAEAVELYHQLKKTKSGEYNFREDQLNRLGNRLLRDGQIKEAIGILTLNVSVYPESPNAYYSLAEAYAKNGQNKEALENYKKCLQLNPKHSNAAEKIKRYLEK